MMRKLRDQSLPIFDVAESLIQGAMAHRRVVLSAPTGSGKSTQVPQILLDAGLAGDGEVVVLQPRRIAARMLARRVAQEREGQVGGEVGYQVRFERVVGRETRIRFVTEGLLLRRLMDDPDLRGVSVLVLDEFHERSIHTDLTLAVAKRLQATTRPDLILVVMSATLETNALDGYLQPCAIVTAEGRTFPVDIAYAPVPDSRNPNALWDHAAAQVKGLLNRKPEGDALIFMPGAYEIRRTLSALEQSGVGRTAELHSLYGDLSPDKQDAAVTPGSRRKVIVSTNVAETSLTIPGVTLVVDGGLARVARFDPRRGINALLVEKISQASATQRAGRAGRTAPGFCLRLYSEKDYAARPAFDTAEIHRVDLCETVLMLRSWGIAAASNMDWIEPPSAIAWETAEQILYDLGALDSLGELTSVGEQLTSLPIHPRWGRILIEASRRGCLEEAADVVALLDQRSILQPLKGTKEEQREDRLVERAGRDDSDLALQRAALEWARDERFSSDAGREWGIHMATARQADRAATQLMRIINSPTDSPSDDPDALSKALLAGLSDHLALRRDKGTLLCDLIHGRRGEISRHSHVRQSRLLVSASMEERNARGGVVTLLSDNVAVEETWLRELFPEDFDETVGVRFDSTTRSVVASREQRFRDLVLESTEEGEPPKEEAAELLAQEVLAGRLVLKKWDDAIEKWIRRLNTIARELPDTEIPFFGKDERQMLLEQICFGANRYKEIREREVWPTVKGFLSAEQAAWLETLAPERFTLPGGSSPKLRYEETGPPVLPATVQQLYDLKGKPAIAEGRLPLRIEILAPNRRPVQITDDLDSFWENSYPEVKKQLRGRYPKHEWR